MEPQPDFFRAVVVTLVVGTVVVGTGAAILFLAFRAMGEDRKGQRRSVGLSIALLAFIFIVCAVFFAWSR